ncbi:hypothetical protein HWV62_25946 [Athelia sp. TMB]|nr:hypothetical protein HWV62_25946 [Athelia sp. TMB]
MPLEPRPNRKAFFIRGLALLGSYILGPLKSRLSREMGTSNAEFSLLIAAFSLNSTWTPLVGGLLAARLGTARASIIATSLILAGQLLLLLGDRAASPPLMLGGTLVFGLGVSPLAVVQEALIVRFFRARGLGVSLALGLVAGKGASFAGARSALPLAEWRAHAPFEVSAALAALSFAVNLAYLASEQWIAREAGVEREAAEIARDGVLSAEAALREVAAKKVVRLRDLARMGDVFWTYIGINVLCGALWAPFTHLAANLIEQRYGLTEDAAASQASILLAGSIVLYPICGWIMDRARRGFVVHRLLLLGSLLTLACYAWLALPPRWTRSAVPALVAFGAGHGFSTLGADGLGVVLLVLLVPRIVPARYVSTALGAHKAIESCGSTIAQTLAGITLDFGSRVPPPIATTTSASLPASSAQIQTVLGAWLLINLLQLAAVAGLLRLDRARSRAQGRGYQPLATSAEPDAEIADTEDALGVHAGSDETLALSPISSRPSPMPKGSGDGEPERELGTGEARRGRVCAALAGATVVGTWALFMVSAAWKLRGGGGRS